MPTICPLSNRLSHAIRVAFTVGLVTSACGPAPKPEATRPAINPRSVPSLALLDSAGDKVRKKDVEAHGKGSSCQDAIAEAKRTATGTGLDADDKAVGEIKERLNKGSYLNDCDVPETSGVDICVGIREGKVLGVTVKLTAGEMSQAECVANGVRAMAFPSHPAFSVARTEFSAPQ